MHSPVRASAKPSRIALGALALAAVMALALPAGAAVIIDQNPGNFPNDSNVVFNPCGAGAVFGPSLTVTGCLNDDTSTLVDFTGNENLIANGGQARVESADADGFTFLEISARNGGGDIDFATLISNIQASNFAAGAPQSASVAITPFIGGAAQATQNFAISEAGQNFFRLSTDDGSLFSSVQFLATNFAISGVVFDDFRQVRLGTGGSTPIPAPATPALLGAGLLGLWMVRRRRARR